MPALPAYRTFIAIELPHDVRARVIEHINKLRRELPDVRASWLRQDNLHLTLKFLGDVATTRIGDISEAVAGATSAIASFELTLSGCGTFPPRGKPNVLWIGVGTQASYLLDLHELIERELATIGYPREQRRFAPHLTIARLKKPRGAIELAALHQSLGFSPVEIQVTQLTVFRSELLKEGSKHTALSRHPLG